jgi:hypothetical protein
MTKYSGIGLFPLVLMLQLVAQPASGEEAAVQQYQYSDEWSVVSAPPPAGPYRSVNIDPRVPGVGAVPPIPMEIQAQETVEGAADATVAEAPGASMDDRAMETAGTLQEDTMNHPPAAGIAVPAPAMVAPVDAAADAMQQYPGSRLPPPGYYGRTMPPTPAFNYPAPTRYPRQAGYPGYPNMPPFGYYNPPVRSQEPEVPPPPVYERQRGYGGWR